MKYLFTVWVMISLQMLSPNWWPEWLVGAPPICQQPQLQGYSVSCGDQSAFRVFTDWWTTVPEPIRDQISNGF